MRTVGDGWSGGIRSTEGVFLLVRSDTPALPSLSHHDSSRNIRIWSTGTNVPLSIPGQGVRRLTASHVALDVRFSGQNGHVRHCAGRSE